MNWGTAQYSYDRRGNLQQVVAGGQTTSYNFNAADRLAGVQLPDGSQVSYGYDAAGRRVRETSGGVTTTRLWDEASPYGDVAWEQSSGGAPSVGYLLAGGELLGQQRGGTVAYYLRDGQQSIRALTDSAGTITDRARYDAFGNRLAVQGSTVNAYGYTGQRFDALTGLYDLRARAYDPVTGRFLSRDRWPVQVGNPIEFNRYGYVANNPINHFDPSGNALVEFSARTRAAFLAVAAITVASFQLSWLTNPDSFLPFVNAYPRRGAVSYPELFRDALDYVATLGQPQPPAYPPGGGGPPKVPFWAKLVTAFLVVTLVVKQIGPHLPSVPPETPAPDPIDPGTDLGTDPGTDPGTNPGPGTDPGPNPGPGTDPGTKPGPDPIAPPSTDPGTDPGTDPAPEPGEQPGDTSQPHIPTPTPDDSIIVVHYTSIASAQSIATSQTYFAQTKGPMGYGMYLTNYDHEWGYGGYRLSQQELQFGLRSTPRSIWSNQPVDGYVKLRIPLRLLRHDGLQTTFYAMTLRGGQYPDVSKSEQEAYNRIRKSLLFYALPTPGNGSKSGMIDISRYVIEWGYTQFR